MLDIISKIWKNKIFVVFVFLILITFPSVFYEQSDKDKTLVTSSIGIDKKGDKLNVSVLAVIPKDGSDVSSNLELFESEGDTISEALDGISLDIGKKIGLAHCDCIIFSEELMQDNLTLILDYFIRTANLSTNPTLIATPNSSKELLEAVKNSNNVLDLSLKSIISSQEYQSVINNVTLDRFYRAYLSPNSTFTIPIIETKKPNDSNEKTGASSGSSNEPASDSGGGSTNSSAGNSGQLKISNKNKIAVIRDGKYIGTLSEPEMFIYSLLSKPSEYQKFTLENISDEHFVNSKVILQEADKFIIPKCTFVDGKPVMEYNIWLSVMIDEVSSTINHSFSSLNGIDDYLTETVEREFYKTLNEKLEITNNLMKEKKYDIMNMHAKYNAYKYQKFKNYISTLEDPTEYISEMSIKINLKLNYVI